MGGGMPMVKVPRHVIDLALTESDVVSDDVEWKYDDGTGSAYFAFFTEEGVSTLAKFFAVLGSVAEVDQAVDFEPVMDLAEGVAPVTRGKRKGFCFTNLEVVR